MEDSDTDTHTHVSILSTAEVIVEFLILPFPGPKGLAAQTHRYFPWRCL